MYRRDLLMAEIQKLTQALSRVLGLRQQGKLEEADQGIDDILVTEFGILFSDLMASTEEDFSGFLKEKNFAAEKLDLLSQFLYLKLNTTTPNAESLSLAGKLQLIYHILETKHHVINMINLDRQKLVKQFINTES